MEKNKKKLKKKLRNVNHQNVDVPYLGIFDEADNVETLFDKNISSKEENPCKKINSRENDANNSINVSATNIEESYFFQEPFKYAECTKAEVVPPQCLSHKFKDVALKHNLSTTAINDILKLFGPFHQLPLDSRTLFANNNSFDVKIQHHPKTNSEFLHVGLAQVLTFMDAKVDIPEEPVLFFNFDGLPLFKSSKISLWPILLQIKPFNPFIVGISCGYEKPDPYEYLELLIKDLQNLIEDGLVCGNKSYRIDPKKIIIVADTPARNLVRMTKAHNGYFGCDGCVDEGIHRDKRMIFLNLNSRKRTDENYMDESEDCFVLHRKGVSPFYSIQGFRMHSQFPRDPMHLVYLGATRRILLYWLKGSNKNVKLTAHQISAISNALQNFTNCLPREFVRKCRTLSHLDRWKATEFRTFLLYLSPVILKDILDEKVYHHYLLFCIGIRILSSFSIEIGIAEKFIFEFVDFAPKLYGQQFSVYNIHSLIHLADDCKIHGPLENFSAFDFENELQKIKKCIKSAKNPLETVRRRLNEGYFKISNKTLNTFVPWKAIKIKNKSVEAGFRDGTFLSNENKICMVYKIIKTAGLNTKLLVQEQVQQIVPIFMYPCSSTNFNIGKVSFHSTIIEYDISSYSQKCVSLPAGENCYFIVPLLN